MLRGLVSRLIIRGCGAEHGGSLGIRTLSGLTTPIANPSGSFQESGAPIQTPNSRALITRTPTKGTPNSIHRNSQSRAEKKTGSPGLRPGEPRDWKAGLWLWATVQMIVLSKESLRTGYRYQKRVQVPIL